MPTTITGAYDKVAALVSTTLPSYVRLPNPYVIDANTFLHLQTDAFGLTVDPGTNTERTVGCTLVTWEQTYTIVLIKRVAFTQNDTANRVTLEKEMLTDWQLVWKAFERDPTLGGDVIEATILGHGGINFVDTERLKFLALFINLSVEHEDTYNP